MTLVQLKHLIELANSGSFSQSALKLHLTQPALSRSIKALEDELGQALFDRIGRKKSLIITLLMMGWTADFPDPITFLDVFKSDGGNNWTGWKSKDYDALLEQAAGTADPAARNSIQQISGKARHVVAALEKL